MAHVAVERVQHPNACCLVCWFKPVGALRKQQRPLFVVGLILYQKPKSTIEHFSHSFVTSHIHQHRSYTQQSWETYTARLTTTMIPFAGKSWVCSFAICACVELTTCTENAKFLYPEANEYFRIVLAKQSINGATEITRQGYSALLVINCAKKAVRSVAQGHVFECEEAAVRSLYNVLATEVGVARLACYKAPERDGDSMVVPSIRREGRDPSTPTCKCSSESKESKESKESTASKESKDDPKEKESTELATATKSTKPSRARGCVLM